jgi:hypothetical protein
MNSIDVVIDDDKKRDTKSSELVEPPPRLLSELAEDDGRKLKKDNIVVVESKKEDEDDTGGSVGPRRTLVVYSGPTSMDRLQDKNGMYIDNMNYFIEHGISCFDDAPESRGGGGGDDDDAESVIVNYAFVLTQEVADHYTAPHGLLTNKIQECEGVDKNVRGSDRGGGGGGGGGEQSIRPFIKVITRLDRCYDMESIRIVVKTMNVQALYDNLLFVNCGLVGPKFGPGSPKLIPSSYSSKTNNNNNNNNNNNAKKKQQQGQGQGQGGMVMVPYSHWSQLYTSRLTDSVRLVGHSINTHFHTFFPHVQSFLYALRTDTVPILLSSGAIYDCGLTQEELGGDPEKRFQLINRYEVGMSTQLLKRGYKIATAFVNRWVNVEGGDDVPCIPSIAPLSNSPFFLCFIRNIISAMDSASPWSTIKTVRGEPNSMTP